jgi:hypothetical protein
MALLTELTVIPASVSVPLFEVLEFPITVVVLRALETSMAPTVWFCVPLFSAGFELLKLMPAVKVPFPVEPNCATSALPGIAEIPAEFQFEVVFIQAPPEVLWFHVTLAACTVFGSQSTHASKATRFRPASGPRFSIRTMEIHLSNMAPLARHPFAAHEG